MPLTAQERELAHARLVRDYRIEFLDELERDQWPESYRGIIDNISELGSTKFAAYATRSEAIRDQPWKLEAKATAKSLVEKARRCTDRNEASWRGACEHIVFSRLSAEVACRKCRKRIWRSEIEAQPATESNTSTALRNRQQSRAPCRCPREERLQDYLEAVGANPIFGHREEDPVQLDENISRKMSQDHQKPDKVVGLRQTRNIENLLFDTAMTQHQENAGGPRLVHEVLSHPLSRKGDPLLFPFLVLEAKSGKAGAEWHSIELQTAFPIRTFLEAQRELQAKSGATFHRQLNPSVWFLFNRGQDWRLSLAYVQRGEERPGAIGDMDYRVVNVWSGSINTLDGALQLLLLIDYIFDWARDIYRENVIKQLRILASGENDAATIIHADTDVFSTAQPFEREPSTVNPDEDGYQVYMREFVERTCPSFPDLVCRHANFVESKYCCLFITRDNVQTFLDSISGSKGLKNTVMVEPLKTPMLLDFETISAMEEQWTGTSRFSTQTPFSNVSFRTVVCCTTYLSTDWRIIRELYVLAVDEDAWGMFTGSSWIRARNCPRISQSSISSTIQRLQAGSPSDILQHAITRRCLILHNHGMIDLTGDTSEDDGAVPCSVPVPNDGALRYGIHKIYESFKKGRLEPQESFLRISTRFDQQDRLKLQHGPLESTGKPLQISQAGGVWIHAMGPSMTEDVPNTCLYIVEGSQAYPIRHDLRRIAVKTIETLDIYHTIRSDRSAQQRREFSGCFPWNLENTHGITHRAFKDLPRLLQSAACLGSIKKSMSNGRSIYETNFKPWRDPRAKDPPIAEELFFRYKTTTQGISSWAEIASRRTAAGFPCCSICAHADCTAVCDVCQAVMMDPARPLWLRNALAVASSNPSTIVLETKRKNMLSLDSSTMDSEFREKLLSYPMLNHSTIRLEGLQLQQKRFQTWLKGKGTQQTSQRQRIANMQRSTSDRQQSINRFRQTTRNRTR